MLTIAPSSILQDGSFNGIPLDQLPAEILLDIIPRIPYSPHNLSCLCLTCTKLNGLIKAHEHSLVAEIKECQFCKHTLALFPGLQPETFVDLSTLHRRLESLDDFHGKWLRIINHGIELQWLKGRWENIHKAGLLLLYRLYDTQPYMDKIELMQSLPATSLACLLFKLISSIKILRIYGPEPINSKFAQQDATIRADVELAFEELLLQHGPGFFIAMLNEAEKSDKPRLVSPLFTRILPPTKTCTCNTFLSLTQAQRKSDASWAVDALETEVSSMYQRQQPYPDGQPKPPTLISSLRRALATRTGCEIGDTIEKMWEILSGTAFDVVDEGKMGMVVGGVQITGGMRRMGF